MGCSRIVPISNYDKFQSAVLTGTSTDKKKIFLKSQNFTQSATKTEGIGPKY